MKIKGIICLILMGTLSLAHRQHTIQKKDLSVGEENGTSERWDDGKIWTYGLIAGFAVSGIGFFAAFLLIFFKRFSSQNLFSNLIQILFAFSCGALLGDAMLHILPEAYKSRYTTQRNVSLVFIAAIFFFIFLERFMNRIGISHSHWHQDENTDLYDSHHVLEKKQLNHPKHVNPPAEKQATGYLNLISSLLHNFIDGLAIGVAFSMGNPQNFIPVTFGIIAHQIPREMGDVAILMKSNFTARETILSNGFINCISLVGVILGLNSHDISPVTKNYVLVFVAGNFLYIASDIWRNLFHHKNNWMNLLEVIGLIIGVALTLGHSHDH